MLFVKFAGKFIFKKCRVKVCNNMKEMHLSEIFFLLHFTRPRRHRLIRVRSKNTWHVVATLAPSTPIERGGARGRGIFNRMCVSDFILILFEVRIFFLKKKRERRRREKKTTLKILLRILTHQLLKVGSLNEIFMNEFSISLVSAHIFHLSRVSFIQWVLRLLMHFTTCNVGWDRSSSTRERKTMFYAVISCAIIDEGK